MKKRKHENGHWCLTTRGVEDSVPLLRSQFACSITELQIFIYSIWKKRNWNGLYHWLCSFLSSFVDNSKTLQTFCFSCKQINLPSPSLSALANIFWIWRKWNKKDLLLQCLEVIELIRKIKNPFEMVWKWLVRSNTNPRPHIMLEATPCNFSKLIINAISPSVLARFIFLIAETQNK